ncbi:talin-1-like [Crassostrea angulata]|uniref:talin-1-like n=1 Tax=Magallana angulata TaxID=2784310 RepID=UPI0022B134C9|nr:talin-1-like [Crassostrea angulata]
MVTICTKMGISNDEEYSLVREMMDDEKEKTLTLRQDKSIAKDQKKLYEMRKKLRTDDELEWLDHSRTLREQGVLDVDTLLLRRKFFFSDRNVDQRDPVQLNLLYVQGKSNLITAGKTVGEASQEVMTGIGETADDMDRMYQETLLALAKAVANATAQLVLKAKSVASTTEYQGLQNKVISSATSCALTTARVYPCTSQNKLIDRATVCTLATFQLEAYSKVVAPTISSPACQEQLIDAAKGVAHSVEGIVEAAQQSCRDDKLLADLGAAATVVGESHEDAVDTILTVTDRLFSSVGDAHEMVRQAWQLAQATSSLVGAIRGEAEGHSDSDMQKRLLAAGLLADATANMVEAAKIMNEQLPLLIQGFRGSETNQDSATAQLQLINASKEFIQVEASAMKLGSTSKDVGSAMAQLLTAASQVNTDKCIMETEIL